MLQPGKNARRTRSCDRGESHGHTQVAREKKEDEGASTCGVLGRCNTYLRETDIMRTIALRISPREMQRCR
jgi:hypothetical protein